MKSPGSTHASLHNIKVCPHLTVVMLTNPNALLELGQSFGRSIVLTRNPMALFTSLSTEALVTYSVIWRPAGPNEIMVGQVWVMGTVNTRVTQRYLIQ